MADDPKPPGKDFIQFGPKVGDGDKRMFLRHRPDHQILVGVAEPVAKKEEARDEAKDYDSLLRVSGEGPLYTVEEVLWERETADAKGGPAMVNSTAYRDGWDNIFGNKTVGEA